MQLVCRSCLTTLRSSRSDLRAVVPTCPVCGLEWYTGAVIEKARGRPGSVPVKTLVEALLYRGLCSASLIARDLNISEKIVNNLFYYPHTYPAAKSEFNRLCDLREELRKAGFELAAVHEDCNQEFIQNLYDAFKSGKITADKFNQIPRVPNGTRCAW